MTAVETPAPAVEARRCPRCGATLTAEQEWCLQCGADVSATIAAPPSWRGPVALVGGLLVVALVALILALVELAGDAEQVAQPGAAPTPVPTTTTVPTPESTTIPPATGDDSASTTPEIADWPAGKDAWTVVLEASGTREAAEARANELAQQGIAVGILDSSQYPSLEPNKFIVFSGQYDSDRAANQALQGLSSQVEGAYVRHVSPTAGGATATPSPVALRDAGPDVLERRPERREPLQRLRGERVALHDARIRRRQVDEYGHQRRHRARQRAEVVAALQHQPERGADHVARRPERRRHSGEARLRDRARGQRVGAMGVDPGRDEHELRLPGGDQWRRHVRHQRAVDRVAGPARHRQVDGVALPRALPSRRPARCPDTAATGGSR